MRFETGVKRVWVSHNQVLVEDELGGRWLGERAIMDGPSVIEQSGTSGLIWLVTSSPVELEDAVVGG